MNEQEYSVSLNDYRVAEHMELEIALVLVKGLFDKYYAEENVIVSVRREAEHNENPGGN